MAPTTTAAPVIGAAAPVVQSSLLQTLLQGGATALGIANAISAGDEKADQLNLAAEDAQRQIPLETLQGISRRSSIKQEMMQRLGQMDTANAASGVDLSFGTPLQARRDAFQQADLGLATDVGTEQTRVARLEERSADYRRRARRAQQSGIFDALTMGLSTANDIAGRG
ncbi:hypothetical protein [Rhizobium sp. SGZ-381]|uniref:hypothetical protein n=1 Tax=Rhizobium sp. SGZ-381 TaxID=3342800 RepID=UPI0036734334